MNCHMTCLKFRSSKTLPPQDRSGRPQLLTFVNGYPGQNLRLLLAVHSAGCTLPAVLLSGRDTQGEGWATLPSFKRQRSRGFAAVIHGADSKRLTNIYLLGLGRRDVEVGSRLEVLQ